MKRGAVIEAKHRVLDAIEGLCTCVKEGGGEECCGSSRAELIEALWACHKYMGSSAFDLWIQTDD